MATSTTDNRIDGYTITSATTKGVATLLAIVTVGYLAFGAGVDSQLAKDDVSGRAVAGQVSRSDASIVRSAIVQDMAAIAAVAPRAVDYFPDRFVTQATTDAEPIDTF